MGIDRVPERQTGTCRGLFIASNFYVEGGLQEELMHVAGELHTCSARDCRGLNWSSCGPPAAPRQGAEFSHPVPQLQEHRHRPSAVSLLPSKYHSVCSVANPNLHATLEGILLKPSLLEFSVLFSQLILTESELDLQLIYRGTTCAWTSLDQNPVCRPRFI